MSFNFLGCLGKFLVLVKCFIFGFSPLVNLNLTAPSFHGIVIVRACSAGVDSVLNAYVALICHLIPSSAGKTFFPTLVTM